MITIIRDTPMVVVAAVAIQSCSAAVAVSSSTLSLASWQAAAFPVVATTSATATEVTTAVRLSSRKKSLLKKWYMKIDNYLGGFNPKK